MTYFYNLISASDGYPNEPGCRYSISSTGTDSLARRSNESRAKSLSPPLPPAPPEEDIPDICITSHEHLPDAYHSDTDNHECHGNTNGNHGDSLHESQNIPQNVNSMNNDHAVANTNYANPTYQQLVRPLHMLPKQTNTPRTDYEAIRMEPISEHCDNRQTNDNNNQTSEGQGHDTGQGNSENVQEPHNTSMSSGESGVVDPNELCEKIDDMFFKDMVIKHKTLV